MPLRSAAVVAAALCGAFLLPAQAQPAYDGYLCCNLRTDGHWMSDSNYADSGKRIVPAGTPVKVTGYGRNRVNVLIDGAKQDIGNDYSRDLDPGAFARRWVVTEDPAVKIAKYPPKLRDAIKSARIARGMTREQVAMAVGYPISSENPRLDAPVWRMWLGSFSEFQVLFDKAGLVRDVTSDAQTKSAVFVN
jgi:hypothetical protein